ncbi:hypothetical protein GCM10022409_20730 [Hymenobacter glaciei]|uniref:Uncharacterized protein n=1 Tax=Hymenobacter glaciei TaxID=877209 RepID=A0ABP7U4D9_9BACT
MPLAAFYLPATPKLLYDGFEDNWASQPWPLPLPDGASFLAQLSRDVLPIKIATEWLGKEAFQQLLRDVQAVVRDWSGQGDWGYKGYDNLPLYCVRHGQQLWVLAAGEFQPARYKTYLHGSWLINQPADSLRL